MKILVALFLVCCTASVYALDPTHFTITRITSPYFVVDGNAPSTLTKSYVGFEIKNNNNSGVTYSGLQFTITSIGTSVVGQNYSLVSPVSGMVNVGTLEPGQTRVCYFYVSYPASVSVQATFYTELSNGTLPSKSQNFTIYNRSSISANAGGTATQTFTIQDIIGGLIYDDVTYAVGNVQNGDESDFQVAVSTQFDPTKIILLGTQVISSTVPGIPTGATDSLYFITGNGSNGASVTIRWTFRIAATNFTTYLLPCAGATSGSTNYKYALNTNLGAGTPVTVTSSSNPLTITKSSDKSLYVVNAPAVFTITINNPGAYGVTIDRITDELPAGFSFISLEGSSQVSTANSTTVPVSGATGTLNFEGGVLGGSNTSYYIPAGGSLVLRYNATASSTQAANLVTTARFYVATTEVGSAQNTVSVSLTLPVTLQTFTASWFSDQIRLNWVTVSESGSSFFEIERRGENDIFRKIGQINAAGYSVISREYTFTDSFPYAGVSQFRLKMIDQDGQYQYSPIRSLTNKKPGLELLKVFPLPCRDRLNLLLRSEKSAGLQLQLADINGNLVFTRDLECYRGFNSITVTIPEGIPNGVYQLLIKTNDQVFRELIFRHR